MMDVNKERIEAVIRNIDQGLALGASQGIVGLVEMRSLLEMARALAAFREHPHFDAVLGNIVVDLIEGLDDSEEYDGESSARREAYQLLHQLLTGSLHEPPCRYARDDEPDEEPVRHLWLVPP